MSNIHKRVQELNVKFLKLVKKCRKQDAIYNGEYNRLKKFYRGLSRDNLFYADDCYHGVSSSSNPLLKKYNTSTWSDIGNKLYLELRSWDKEKIKSGKRPVSDTEEYNQKLLLRSLASDLGTCGYCERIQEIENKVIYDHGFKKIGFRAGVCRGANHLPYERSPEAKELLVNDLKSDLESIILQTPNEKMVSDLNAKVHIVTENCKLIDRTLIYKNVGDYKRRTYLGSNIYNKATLEDLKKIFIAKKTVVKESISREQEKLNVWKAVPTLRERAILMKLNK
tara:strand:+ start:62 stop:904 length:843 start_codon:yes stop_codon:yes gene_type:complete